jgi:hypothetical protein
MSQIRGIGRLDAPAREKVAVVTGFMRRGPAGQWGYPLTAPASRNRNADVHENPLEKTMKIARSSRLTALGSALLLAAVAQGALADPAHKWRIEFSGQSSEDGTVVLRLNPINGKSINVETRVPARSGDNHVALVVADSLKLSLGDRYHVQTDDGESVIVSTGGDGPRFDLSLERSTLSGVQIEIEPE